MSCESGDCHSGHLKQLINASVTWQKDRDSMCQVAFLSMRINCFYNTVIFKYRYDPVYSSLKKESIKQMCLTDPKNLMSKRNKVYYAEMYLKRAGNLKRCNHSFHVNKTAMSFFNIHPSSITAKPVQGHSQPGAFPGSTGHPGHEHTHLWVHTH